MDHYMGFRAFRDLWIAGWGFVVFPFVLMVKVCDTIKLTSSKPFSA